MPSSSSHLFRQHRREESYRALLVRLFVLLESTQSGGLSGEPFQVARREFMGHAESILDQEGSLLIAEREGHLFFNGVRAQVDLAGFTALKFLVRTMRARGLSGFLLMQGLGPPELVSFFEVLLAPPASDGEEICQLLDERGVQNVQPVLHVEEEFVEILGTLSGPRTGSGKPASYFKSIFLLRHLLSGLEDSEIVDVREAKELLLGLVEYMLDEDGVLAALDRLKGCDSGLFRHGVESAVLARELGRQLGLAPHLLDRLGVCALLHDFGHARLHEGTGERLSFQHLMGGENFSELVLECAIVAHAYEELDELEGDLDPQTELFARIVEAVERFIRLVERGRRYGVGPERVAHRMSESGLAPELARALRNVAAGLSRLPARTNGAARRAQAP